MTKFMMMIAVELEGDNIIKANENAVSVAKIIKTLPTCDVKAYKVEEVAPDSNQKGVKK